MERCFPVWSQVDGENESHGPPLHCLMALLFLAESLCSVHDSHLKPDGRPALFLLYWDLPDQLWTCGESTECFGAVLGDTLYSLDSWEQEDLPMNLTCCVGLVCRNVRALPCFSLPLWFVYIAPEIHLQPMSDVSPECLVCIGLETIFVDES